MIKFNKKECYVTKRSLILDCIIKEGITLNKHIRFEFDDWSDDKCRKILKIDGVKQNSFKVISYTKHELQVALAITEVDDFLFIDRRYEHNSSFNIYFKGRAFVVNSIKRKKELDKSFKKI